MGLFGGVGYTLDKEAGCRLHRIPLPPTSYIFHKTLFLHLLFPLAINLPFWESPEFQGGAGCGKLTADPIPFLWVAGSTDGSLDSKLTLLLGHSLLVLVFPDRVCRTHASKPTPWAQCNIPGKLDMSTVQLSSPELVQPFSNNCLQRARDWAHCCGMGYATQWTLSWICTQWMLSWLWIFFLTS